MKISTGLFYPLFFVFLCSSLAISGEDTWKQKKPVDCSKEFMIELIKSEVAYARYIAWQTRKKLLPTEDGLLWVEDILGLVEEQLNEIENE